MVGEGERQVRGGRGEGETEQEVEVEMRDLWAVQREHWTFDQKTSQLFDADDDDHLATRMHGVCYMSILGNLDIKNGLKCHCFKQFQHFVRLLKF